MQGSGTFGVESVLQTVCKPLVPKPGCKDDNESATKFLILENGAYGQRMATICKRMGVQHQMASFPEDRSIDLSRVEALLATSKTAFTSVVGEKYSYFFFAVAYRLSSYCSFEEC